MTYIDNALALISGPAREKAARHIISSSATVIEALRALNALSGSSLTLFAADESGRIAGTLTDGDIRRGMLAGIDTSRPLADILHTDFLAIREDDDPFLAFDTARKKGIRLLPRLLDGKLLSLHDLHIEKTILPLDAVLMAGGRGERLRPLTLSRPKPLLPVGGKAIIDYNVEELEKCGIASIFVTINYLGEQISEHFRSRVSRAHIRCVGEPKRLGTIGSLSLVAPQLSEPDLIVMNSDLLTTLDYEAFFRHHKATGADLTIAAVPYSVSVPYAILKTEDDHVLGLEEKPTFNYLANGGVYILKRELVGRIPADTYVDAPDFISALIEDGLKVAYFPIDGTWIDIGTPNDYQYADRLMSQR